MIKLFCENYERLKAADYFYKKLHLRCFPLFNMLIVIYWLDRGVYPEGLKAVSARERLEDCPEHVQN